jgi:hypothetical protein
MEVVGILLAIITEPFSNMRNPTTNMPKLENVVAPCWGIIGVYPEYIKKPNDIITRPKTIIIPPKSDILPIPKDETLAIAVIKSNNPKIANEIPQASAVEL